MKKSTVVLGLGNPLMADEGIGVYLLERLAEQAAQYDDVDFIDAGTGGMSVLHLIDGRAKAVFIDCAFMDEEPGTLRRFTPEDVRSTKVLAHQSLHDADLLHILTLAEQFGQRPDDVVIFGIQPKEVRPGSTLTEEIGAVIARVIEQVLVELHV